MIEQWKTIPDFPDYEISDWGRVKSHKNLEKPKILKGSFSTKGYPQALLYSTGGPKTKPLHILVLEAFVGSRPHGFQACHNDGDKTNNRNANLRWDSPRNNEHDTIRHSRKRGFRRASQKLREKQVLEIREDPRLQRVIAKEYNIAQSMVSMIKLHQSWLWLE